MGKKVVSLIINKCEEVLTMHNLSYRSVLFSHGTLQQGPPHCNPAIRHEPVTFCRGGILDTRTQKQERRKTKKKERINGLEKTVYIY